VLKSIDIVPAGGRAGGLSFFSHPQNSPAMRIITNKNDIVFFTGDKSFTKVCAGMFAIFFPGDVHMPGISTGKISDVKKLVIKVRTT